MTLAARQNAAQTPSDKIAANGQLDGAIGRLFLIVENYPQLIARERPTTDDHRLSQKPNILPVRASHSGETHFDIYMLRVSGIPSDSEVSDTRGLACAAAASRFW